MDEINLINRKCIEELFSIYKEVKLLFVKDDTFSYNSIIEDIFSNIKEEKFSYEIYEKRKQYLIALAFSYIAKNIEYWFD